MNKDTNKNRDRHIFTHWSRGKIEILINLFIKRIRYTITQHCIFIYE